MSPEKDEELCKRYPKIFKNRYASMQTTCMCWGFECGDGWYNIINKLCSNIQGHIDWKRKQRTSDLRYNRALKAALAGDKSKLMKYHSYRGKVSHWTLERVEEDITNAKYREVTEKIPQVVAAQVKEKFGGLRFYYDGGDEYISGLSAMAESMSYVTCETCGKPGKSTNTGWIKTVCEEHGDKDETSTS